MSLSPTLPRDAAAVAAKVAAMAKVVATPRSAPLGVPSRRNVRLGNHLVPSAVRVLSDPPAAPRDRPAAPSDPLAALSDLLVVLSVPLAEVALSAMRVPSRRQ